MSLKSYIVPRLAERILSRDRLDKQRARFEAKRTGRPHVEVFLDPSDPYSLLLKSVLPDFEARYDIDLTTHYVGPPDDGAAPERDALATYAAVDAARLAARAGIETDLTPQPLAIDTEDADARLRALGHYQGGMIHYGGEWYWGLDRLHYLENRLAAIGARRRDAPATPIFTPPARLTPRPIISKRDDLVLHWYLSFRSPYTAIVADRVEALAATYGAELRLRFVLPMVMRALPVPKAKRRYIVRDTAREAHRLGVLFGRVSDPVGTPVERGYAVLNWAMDQGHGIDFARTFLRYVWAEGIDAGSDRGLRRIVEGAELNWSEARKQLGTDDWRAIAESNRAEMMSYGIWGVPSFRVGDTAVWGQDRLWVVEDALKNAL
ncbi:MAG: 2-hydroxychromene-2-carboxylate isomerase [Litorimonas sp.]